MHWYDASFDTNDQRRAWSIIDAYFSSHGLTLRRGHDFEALDAMALASGMRPLEGHFTPTLNTYTPSQAFWLALLDADGQLAGRVCARLDVIDPRMSLTDFWRKYFHRCYPDAGGGKVTLKERQPRIGSTIQGRVAYLGGCEVRKDWRSIGLGGLLTQMIQIDAFDTWSADYFYAWIQGRTFADAFWRDCGFTKAVFHAIRWQEPLPDTLDANLIFAGNSASDIADLIELIVENSAVPLSGKTAPKTRPLSGTAE